MTRLTDIEKAIKIAFPDVECPAEVTIDLDRWHPHSENAEVNSRFLGKGWRDISLAEILPECPSAFLLNDVSFNYYLPAFILATLANSNAGIIERLLNRLGPPAKKSESKRHPTYDTTCFSEEQLAAVRSFLIYLLHAGLVPQNLSKRFNSALWNFGDQVHQVPTR